MDIVAIQDAINDLLEADTTVSNVQELASLYIVQENMKNTLETTTEGDTTTVQQSILPQYTNYIEILSKFQRNEVTEDAVVVSTINVCAEIEQLIRDIYSSTYSTEQRSKIKSMIHRLSQLN